MNQTFDINRTMLYARLKFAQNKKMLLIALGGFFGLIFIITFFIAFAVNAGNEGLMNGFHGVAMVILLFGGGLWITGRSYQDMNSPQKALSQLMLPVSNVERFVVPLFSSTILWMVIIPILYHLVAFLLNGMWGIMFGKDFGFFNLFDATSAEQIGDVLKAFVVVHSVFFLGGIAFKRYPIAKTFLSLFIVQFGWTVLSTLTAIILFGSLSDFGFGSQTMVFDDSLSDVFKEETFDRFKLIVEMLFVIVVPATLYTAAFFKVKEREV